MEQEPRTKSNADSAPALTDVAFCPGCFYDLRGTRGGACPECGETFTAEQLRRGLIAWAQRRELGRLRGYCRTAWQATVRPRQLSYAVAQPVSYRDARWFQIITVLWAVLALACMYAATLTLMAGTETQLEWPLIVISAAALLFLVPVLLAITSVHTYWLHPRHLPVEQQNRAIALGYYAAAPLAFLPFVVLIAVVGSISAALAADLFNEQLIIALIFVSWVPLLAIPVALLRVMLVIARRAAQREMLGLTIMGVSLPMLWLALTVILLLMSGVIAYAGMILYTLLS